MDARTALRQIALQALANPDLDLSGIPDVHDLLHELQQDRPQLPLTGTLQRPRHCKQRRKPARINP